jgi:two-component sensor histidine kinase
VDIEPKSDDHQAGLGLDIGLSPLRKAAFEQARDEQRVVASAPVDLMQPFKTTGYLLFSPAFNERGFVGCITYVFRVDRLLDGFARGRRIPMNLRAYDVTDPDRLIFLAGITRQGDIQAGNSSVRVDDTETIQHSVAFAGRTILVLFETGPDLVQAGSREAMLVGSFGLLLTAIILWGIYHFMRSSRRLASEIATSNAMKDSLQLMNRELVHRVGNLLAVAQGIIRLSYSSSFSTADFKDSILNRLHALNQSVGLINREDWRGVWFHELLLMELAPIADRVDVSGGEFLLKPKAAQSLSLLFYELMTNSSKHGALSKLGGRVAAEWEIKDTDTGRQFFFRWKEHEHGIVEPPARQGFGTKLLTRLVPGDLSGRATLNYEGGWFRYELAAPAERIVEQETRATEDMKAFAPLRVARVHSDADEVAVQPG